MSKGEIEIIAWEAGEQRGLSYIPEYGYEKSEPNSDSYITNLKLK